MMRFALAVLLAAFTVQPGAAQRSPEVQREQRASGLVFHRIAMPRAQMQSLQIIWSDASGSSPEFPAGLASVAPALMMRGPKGELLGEITETLRDYQASFSFQLGLEYASLSISSPPEHFQSTLEILKRFLDNPALPQKRLDNLRRESRLTSLQALRRPDHVATQLRLLALLDSGAVRTRLLTDPARLDGVSISDIERWRKAALTRNKTGIVTAGPLARGDVGAAIEKLLDALPDHGDQPPVEPVMMRKSPPRMVALEMPAPQTIIQAFGPTTVGRTYDDIAASIAIQRMGGGAQGRLHAALRDRLGATYGAQMSNLDFVRGAQAVLISSAVEHGKVVEAVAAIREEYARW